MSQNTWLAKNLQYVLSTFELFLVLPSLYLLLRWADFFAFFGFESPAVGYIQHSFMHLALQIRTSQRASHAALPVLRSQETLSQCCHVMQVSSILSGRERKLTFLSVTDTYVRTYTRTLREEIPHSKPCANALSNNKHSQIGEQSRKLGCT